MKHILSFGVFNLNEGVEQFNIISNLSKIVLKYFYDYKENTTRLQDKKSITYNTLFAPYKNDKILGGFLSKLKAVMDKERKGAGIHVYYREPYFLSTAQSDVKKIGGFDAKDTLNLYVFNYETIESTLRHELSHLYDYVNAKYNGYNNTDSYVEYEQDRVDYYEQEYEVRARFYGFVNNVKLSMDDFDDLTSRMIRAVKPNDKLGKKYTKLLYKIWYSAKNNELPSVTLIEKDKILVQRLSTLEKLEMECGKYNLKIEVDTHNPKHYTLRSGILGVISEQGGEISYPLLEKFLHFFHKDKKMRITIRGISLVRVIREKYYLEVYSNSSNYNTLDVSWHIKHRKLKSDTKINTEEEVSRVTKEFIAYLHDYNMSSIITSDVIEKAKDKFGIVNDDAMVRQAIDGMLKLDMKLRDEVYARGNNSLHSVDAFKVGRAFEADLYKKLGLSKLNYPAPELHFKGMDLRFLNCHDIEYVKTALGI
jgi:hypothetical protein